MNDISVAIVGSPEDGKYLPMLRDLGDKLCYCYSIGCSRSFIYPIEIAHKMRFSKIPPRIAYVIKPFLTLLGLPQYLTYWIKVKLFDYMFAYKVKNDESKIVYTVALLNRTIMSAKKAGKIIVLEAGNSAPRREYDRIIDEYRKYDIKHFYIYGDSKFKNSREKGLDSADKIINISIVSRQTYIDAGFDERKLVLIPLTGTDFPIQPYNANVGKQKVFITTAFHNFIKGTHRLLLAWQKAKVKNIPLIVVGQISEDLQEFINRYGPFDNVKFVGLKSNLKDWYTQYDAVGILMSFSEGAVRVTPEMMSFGFPMIVSPDATCDLVKDGFNGYIIEPTNESGLSERLKWFAEDWNRVRGLRHNVLNSVSYRSVKDYSMELSKYLQSLISK